MSLSDFKDKLDESIKRIDNANNPSLSSRVKNIKELRVSTDIELKSIAHKTKISLKNLKSIENLDFDKLPSEPWRNSFITQYCECIENFSKKEN
ncbi:helix-turn-helix domain-containing protein [Pelagibacteraceae bacterium]|nr:helix-turn-helix domain-containing protein [Pelagibacteraceae bacterium]